MSNTIDHPPSTPVGAGDDGGGHLESGPTGSASPVARLTHPRAIRWLHWINLPLLFIMIWSGMRIYWAEDVYAFGVGSWQWFAFFPDAVYDTLDLERRLARGMAFHFSFGWLFVLNGAIYATYLAASGQWRYIVPDRRTPKEASEVLLHDLHLRASQPPKGKYNAAQRLAYTVVLVMSAIVVVSGFAIYKPTQLHPLPLLFGGYQGARLIHFWMTIGILVFFLVHVLQVVRSGWNSFRSMIAGYEIEQGADDPDAPFSSAQIPDSGTQADENPTHPDPTHPDPTENAR